MAADVFITGVNDEVAKRMAIVFIENLARRTY